MISRATASSCNVMGMSELSPCPSCRRHVKESLCPFCGSRVARQDPVATFGTMSRAMVFASATLAATAGCAHKQHPNNGEMSEERHAGGNGCMDPDQDKIKELEARKAEVDKQPDSEEKEQQERQLEEELNRARVPVCAPYGAPPARRRIV